MKLEKDISMVKHIYIKIQKVLIRIPNFLENYMYQMITLIFTIQFLIEKIKPH